MCTTQPRNFVCAQCDKHLWAADVTKKCELFYAQEMCIKLTAVAERVPVDRMKCPVCKKHKS